MRKVHDVINILLNTHVELARATAPEAVEVINNLRNDLHILADDIVKAARGQVSDIEI